jgi:hypothetical protein
MTRSPLVRLELPRKDSIGTEAGSLGSVKGEMRRVFGAEETADVDAKVGSYQLQPECVVNL